MILLLVQEMVCCGQNGSARCTGASCYCQCTSALQGQDGRPPRTVLLGTNAPLACRTLHPDDEKVPTRMRAVQRHVPSLWLRCEKCAKPTAAVKPAEFTPTMNLHSTRKCVSSRSIPNQCLQNQFRATRESRSKQLKNKH